MTTDGAVAAEPANKQQEELLEEVDNPIERLKLLSGSDDEIAKYLDAIEVTSPREREMLYEISRTRPLAQPDRFAQAHRNMVEALESLARHGWQGTKVGAHAGPFRWFVRWGVELGARYIVVSQIRTLSTRLRNLYSLREMQALPGTQERRDLRRARMDAERMVDALKTKEIAVPAFLFALALPLVAATGHAAGWLSSTPVATAVGVIGMLVALAVSWFLLRGAAVASRRIRLATRGPVTALWETIGWCGKPPKDQTRTFVLVSVGLTLCCWIIVPILVTIALVT